MENVEHNPTSVEAADQNCVVVETFPGIYAENGRIASNQLYLLLCEELDCIYVKIGRAWHPQQRLAKLMAGCPFFPGVLATCAMRSYPDCVSAEAALHREFQQWRLRGEWFRFKATEKPAFNDLLRKVLSNFKQPNWPIEWVKHEVSDL